MSGLPALLAPDDEYADVFYEERDDTPQSSSELSSDWLSPDPVVELLGELFKVGRTTEAQTVARVLGYADEDENAVRDYVSALWSADWDNPQDAVYDEA